MEVSHRKMHRPKRVPQTAFIAQCPPKRFLSFSACGDHGWLELSPSTSSEISGHALQKQDLFLHPLPMLCHKMRRLL